MSSNIPDRHVAATHMAWWPMAQIGRDIWKYTLVACATMTVLQVSRFNATRFKSKSIVCAALRQQTLINRH